MNVLAIIPARGGSKGIPRKNLSDVCGKPLIYWSIKTAHELHQIGAISQFIVSTDDEEIANISRGFGATVPFLRPKNISGDKSKSSEFVCHALSYFEGLGLEFDFIMLLQPTSPIRNTGDIRNGIVQLHNNGGDSLISCYQEDYINELVSYDLQENGLLQPHHVEHNKGFRRQDSRPTMVRNGAVYITRVSFFKEHQQLICDMPLPLIMKKVDSIDVDTFDDLELLRAVMCRSVF